MCTPSGTDSGAVIRSNTTAEQDATQRKKNADKASWNNGSPHTPESQRAKADEQTTKLAAQMLALAPKSNNETANEYLARTKASRGFSILPPADAPDLTDKALQSRKMGQALALMAGRGRKQSFLGGGDYGSSALGGGAILGGA